MDRPIEKKSNPYKLLIRVLVVSSTMLIFYLLFRQFGQQEVKVNANQLSIESIRQGNFQEFVPVTGIVQPTQTVYLDAIEGGHIKKVYVEDGALVQKGDTLLRLSNSTLQLDLMNREAQLLEQINNLSNTRISLEEEALRLKEEHLKIEYLLKDLKKQHQRNESLYQDRLIAQEEYEATKDEYEYQEKQQALVEEKIEKNKYLRRMRVGQIERSITLMQQNLDFIHQNLSNLVVLAPINGKLSSLNAELGTSVNKGENLGQIGVTDVYKVSAKIDEHYVSRIFPEQEGTFDFNGKKYSLRIQKIYPEVKEGAFEIDLQFPDSIPAGIKRGQSLQIKLSLSDQIQALLLPKGSFYNQNGAKWVYVVDEKNDKAYKRIIKVGRQNPQYLEVVEGLKEGEKIITSNYQHFNESDVLLLN